MQRGHAIRPLERAEDSQEPWVFLAGPIQGAADWQAQAIELLHAIDPVLNIANPRSAEPFHGNWRAQVHWESYYLRLAALTGCILFWGAEEQKHTCNRAYAQTTRFELGEWFALHQFLHCQVVIGCHTRFTGMRYLCERYFFTPTESVRVHHNLEAVCTEAAARARMHTERGTRRESAFKDSPLNLNYYRQFLENLLS
ncbi:MAG: hypothetical protein ACOYBJ_00725 [Patescibacteria group bacterium]|jgi:hypothetical protein